MMVALFLMFHVLFAVESYALDPSIFWGTWESASKKMNIKIVIKDAKNVVVEINNKVINGLKSSYCYCGQPRKYPFLSLTSSQNDDLHYIYLTIGSDGKNGDLNILRGFYEFSTVADQREIEETFSYPIELSKKQEN